MDILEGTLDMPADATIILGGTLDMPIEAMNILGGTLVRRNACIS